jgi:hypothetical protein
MAAIRALFAAARYNWDDPLSAQAFREWRESLADRRDTVTEVRRAEQECFEIRTSTASGELAEASITLTSQDLRPVESTLRFRNDEWVEVTQASVAPAPPPAVAEAKPAIPAAGAPLREVKPAEPRPATFADELRVMAVLHRLGADLGEPVEVTRAGSEVLVRGTGLAPERQREIESALTGLPRVVVRFGAAGERGPEAAAVLQPSGRTELQQLAAGALDECDDMMARVYALRRLAERFPRAVEAVLGGEERRVLAALRREHAIALHRRAQEIERLLGPALVPFAASAPARSPALPSAWQPAAEELFRCARRVERLLAAALGGSSEDAPKDLAAQLAFELSALRLRAEACERAARE